MFQDIFNVANVTMEYTYGIYLSHVKYVTLRDLKFSFLCLNLIKYVLNTETYLI